MRYSYFPGCSLSETAKDYDSSARLVSERLGISLEELNGWVCCGANAIYDDSLALKNLSLAIERGISELVCACPACFNRLARAPSEKINVRHLIDVLINDIGISKIKECVKKGINLSCVCYYGCLLTRPKEIAFENDIENPESLDILMSSIGLSCKAWAYKTECCGGDLSIPRTDIVLKRCYEILKGAKDFNVDFIVVACPLCQINLDLRQKQIEKRYKTTFNIPILYFTELLSLSFGFNIKFKKHIVSPNF